MNILKKRLRYLARKRRTNTLAKNSDRPRLLVVRSNKTIYAQVIDDDKGLVLCGTSGLKLKSTGIAAAQEVGKAIADLAKKKKVTKVCFDRNGYAYQGQIKSLAEAAREGGLEF